MAVQVPKQDDPIFTIIHESVHVWQAMMTYMGEDSPGVETEAYTIEHICKELMLQYEALTGEKLAIQGKMGSNGSRGKGAAQTADEGAPTSQS